MMLENDCVNRSSDNEILWGTEYNNDGMIAVSYTHLDVYKRQNISCKASFFYPACPHFIMVSPLQSPHFYVHFYTGLLN